MITPDTYKLLNEKDISLLVLNVLLHDLGKHLQPLTFKKMITGGYDDVLNADFGDQGVHPYDIEDRKKKFPKAFKELEPYMRKYLVKK
ncbi:MULTISPECIES: hypothetical protein [Niastella]|uniref:HD domain-containing protein n=1 Tax=Niastella soli TaxID=2821487 RepID=A0ABS3YYM4_9BACT|nr:hypothetical protein [Niastella soli]MBO9202256.1 hypothetical protein [Niastella soli]